jgi:hypothetical protein
MIELVMVLAEVILVWVLEAVAYVVMWAILVPCSFVAATPVVLALALIRPGSFRENARRDYGAIYRSLDGIVDWTRRDGPKTSRR